MRTASAARPVGEIVCAGGLLALALFVLLYGLRYALMKDGVVGPGLMPAIAGIALAVAAGSLLWQALRRPVLAEKKTEPKAPLQAPSLSDFSEDEPEKVGKPATVAGILGMLSLSALLAPVLGLIPMMGVLVFVCVFVFERQGFLVALALAAGSATVSWLLFVRLFEISMPAGSIWQSLGL